MISAARIEEIKRWNNMPRIEVWLEVTDRGKCWLLGSDHAECRVLKDLCIIREWRGTYARVSLPRFIAVDLALDMGAS